MDDLLEQVRAFVALVELQEIGYFELFAARGLIGVDGERAIVGPGRLDDGSEVSEAGRSLGVYWTDDGTRVLVRILTSLKSDAGEIRVGVQAEYVLTGTTRANVTSDVEREFVNRVAVMAIVPYLRSAVTDLSARVFGTTYTMGVVRAGEMEFAPPGDEGADLQAIAGSAGD